MSFFVGITSGAEATAYYNLGSFWKRSSTPNLWVWMSGDNARNVTSGTYGTAGVAALTNVPTHRKYPASWTDSSGNFYIFGGQTGTTLAWMNDLWKWDGTNWTFLIGNTGSSTTQYGTYGSLGVRAATNRPPGRNSPMFGFNPVSGVAYVFGGEGCIATTSCKEDNELNDLWKWDGTYWTWVSGSRLVADQAGTYGTKGVAGAANMPASRFYGVGWVDSSDNFWVFGGGTSSGTNRLSDLWKWDGANWTWMSGTPTSNLIGTYGTRGVISLANNPPGRALTQGYIDSSNDLWLFGGAGGDISVASNTQNSDLWKFNGSAWTFVGPASGAGNQLGTYGTRGVGVSGVWPGGANRSTLYYNSGTTWMLAGAGCDSTTCGTSAANSMNTIWRFDGTFWTWVGGDKTNASTGTYGTKGVANSANRMGSRNGVAGYVDSSGNIWLYGGLGYVSSGTGVTGDLWKYTQ